LAVLLDMQHSLLSTTPSSSKSSKQQTSLLPNKKTGPQGLLSWFLCSRSSCQPLLAAKLTSASSSSTQQLS
jgi:hypothetical protein